ncbi:hypothetical protein JL722_15082 [Aureococcus anophagefferens]|nr:hypothetical protein JL722_15082 [Aureococcus anophagefferens]
MGINILVLTFEYDAFTFSGNGVYAQSLVRGLEMVEGVSVDVVCGGPFGAENCQPPSKAAVVVNLPRWGHLDASCCFREFAAQVYEHLSRKKPLPMVYLNFRVFSRSGPPGASQHGAAFFKAQEFAMMDRSWLTLALSETDAAFLRELHPNAEVRVLLPPIRADVMTRAQRPLRKADVPERHLITCCVRLSDEKEPERFVRLVENLAERKAFDGVFGYKVGLRPVLVTGRCDVDTPLVRRFLDAHPETDVYAFLDAEGLEELYRKSLLHVHPPAYDPFGMAVAEAAAFGAPTVFLKGADVGAKTILQRGDTPELDPRTGKELFDQDAFFEFDLDDDHAGYVAPEDRPTTADLEQLDEFDRRRWIHKHEDAVTELLRLVRDESRLRDVGRLAKKRALPWTEKAHGARLMDFLVPILSEAQEAKRQLQNFRRPEPAPIKKCWV